MSFIYLFKNKIFNLFLLTAVIGCFYSYFYLVQDQQQFIVDDGVLVAPIERIPNFIKDYPKMEKTDFQPVRDWSFYLDARLSHFLGFKTYRITNFVLFILIALIALRCVKNFDLKINLLTFFVVIITHPVFSLSIYWISTRKHLLASLYLLMAISVFCENKILKGKDLFYFYFSLVFSFLSQPIHLWAPFWLVLCAYFENKNIKTNKKISWALVGCLISIVIGGMNLNWYFSRKVPGAINVGGIYDFQYAGDVVLEYSRYFFNTLFPYSLQMVYSQSSIFNILGLPLLIIFVISFLKINNQKRIHLLMLPLSVFLVTFHKIGSFISDTYSIIFSIILLALLVKVLSLMNKRVSRFILSIFILSNSYLLYQRCKILPNYEEFFRKNVAEEYTDGAMGYYIHSLISKGKEIQAVKLFKAFVEVMNESTVIPVSLLRSTANLVYTSSVLYPDEKIKLLSSKKLWCSSVPFFDSLLLFEHGLKDHAFLQAGLALHRTYYNDPYLNNIAALYFIHKELPDLVLLDLMVPDIAGDEVLRRMRASMWGKQIPVLIISNLNEVNAPAGLRQLGIVDYLVKANLSDDQIDQIVNNILRPVSPESTPPPAGVGSTPAALQ